MTVVTPTPAATMLLVRDTEDGVEVLMLQRNLKSRFMPGAYVFPGGALDRQDYASEMQALCSGISDQQASHALSIAQGGLAYWAAAIRESFEEAGLLLAYDVDGHLIELEDPDVAERVWQHRQALNQGTHSLLEILRGECLMLAADQLVYFSHWITPDSAPRRFDTRFFVAVAPPAQAPLHDNQETIGHVWVRPSDALDRHKQKDFTLRFPTMRTLEELAGYSSVNALMQAARAKRDIQANLVRISKEGGRLLPGDPGYDDMVKREMQAACKM